MRSQVHRKAQRAGVGGRAADLGIGLLTHKHHGHGCGGLQGREAVGAHAAAAHAAGDVHRHQQLLGGGRDAGEAQLKGRVQGCRQLRGQAAVLPGQHARRHEHPEGMDAAGLELLLVCQPACNAAVRPRAPVTILASIQRLSGRVSATNVCVAGRAYRCLSLSVQPEMHVEQAADIDTLCG